MKSPQDMRIIQIDITNACVFQCSNCTRFCGHHVKPFFMDFETFKRAVDSLEGYIGTVGIMGGEPTLHPAFEQMVSYISQKRPPKFGGQMLRPQRHFMAGIRELELENTILSTGRPSWIHQTVNGAGLWATTLANYKRYYEIIQDSIPYQALNDHSNPSYHQPALISRKELGISDDAWIKLRDNCWLQNLWSATITPKGAFFCEIAGALDMLFNGPGGWEIESGWWKKTPEEFSDQLHWCEMCGLACQTFSRNANEHIYDVSPEMHKKLVTAGSRIVGTEYENIVKIKNGIISDESKVSGKWFNNSMPYTESYGARLNESSTKLTYKEIVGIIVCYDADEIPYALENVKHFREVYIYGCDSVLAEIKKHIDINVIVHNISSDKYLLGYTIYEALKMNNPDRYAILIEGRIWIKNVIDELMELVLNPGTLLISKYKSKYADGYFEVDGSGRVAFFNGIAMSFRNVGWDTILKMKDIAELEAVWQKNKIFAFSPKTVYDAPSIKVIPYKRYVIYGAGRNLRLAVEKILAGKAIIVAVVDSSVEKQGREILGFTVKKPDIILDDPAGYDYISISSSRYYRDIRNTLSSMGIEEDKISCVL